MRSAGAGSCDNRVQGTVMTITPKPEQERILAEAIQAGLVGSPEDALEVGLDTLRMKLAVVQKQETAEEWIAKFHAWITSHAGQTVVLSDEAMSRESIYADRSL
jgi:hypothetical protein